MISYWFTGLLKAETPVHVGTGEEGETVDAGIARDHDERGVLWGTALEGVMRDIAEREAAACALGKGGFDYLFGKPQPKEKGAPKPKAAERESHLWVFDAPIKADAPDTSFNQTRIRIKPDTDTVAEGALFSEEHAESGTPYDFEVRLDVENAWDDAQKSAAALLWRVLEHLRDGSVRVGGKASVGRGRVKLEGLRVKRRDWGKLWDEEGYEDEWLDEGGWATEFARSPSEAPTGADERPLMMRMVFEAELTFRTPLMIQEPVPVEPVKSHPCGKTPQDCGLPEFTTQQQEALNGKEVLCEKGYYDGVNYRYRLGETDTVYVPGSSIRGALRNRLLQQMRTKAVRPELAWDVSKEGSREQGHPRKADDVDKELGENGQIDRDKPNKYVCLVSRLFGYAALGGTVFVEDVPLGDVAKDSEKGLIHVAIDRITRAPDSGKLFANLVIWPEEDQTATLRVELLDPYQYDIGVVVLLLKDIYRGHIRIGHGKSIGQGRLGLKGCRITAYVLPESKDPPQGEETSQVGSFEKRTTEIVAPADPIGQPSWVPGEHPWFGYLSECAKAVYQEAKGWADSQPADAPKGGTSHGG